MIGKTFPMTPRPCSAHSAPTESPAVCLLNRGFSEGEQASTRLSLPRRT